MLALPGCAYVYQGEELGLPEVLDVAGYGEPVVASEPLAGTGDGHRLPVDSAAWFERR